MFSKPNLLVLRGQNREERVVSDDIDLTFEGVEDPAGGSDREDEPLVAGDAGVPGARAGLRFRWIQAVLVNSKISR